MPGILTPPQRVSRLYSHTSAAKNGRPTHDVADIIVLGAAGDARSRALSLPAAIHLAAFFLRRRILRSAEGSERELSIRLRRLLPRLLRRRWRRFPT